jgi:single-strand DNA-binding protein
MQNINSVVITGNLTHDPQLRYTAGGTAVANLRVAVNGRRKDGQGEWADTVNYFNVTVWGARGKSCAEHLAKGRAVGVEGRLEWNQWEAADGGGRREGVKIVAETVQFLSPAKPAEAEEAQPETRELAGVGAGGDDSSL